MFRPTTTTSKACLRSVINGVDSFSFTTAASARATGRGVVDVVGSHRVVRVVRVVRVPSYMYTPLSSIRWFSSTSTEKETEAAEDNSAPEEEEEEAEEEEETPEEDPTMKLQEEVQKLTDQLYRAVAEQDNIRKIARNDVQAAQQFAIKKFAKSLLDVADNLDRALDSVEAHSSVSSVVENDDENDAASTSTSTFQSFFEGIELTKSGLVKALESNGVTAYCETPGDVFEPEKHNALMEYPDPNSQPGTVGQVIKKGYMLNGRVLRPAEVGVVKK